MAKRWIVAGATNQTIDIFVQDSSSTIGAGLSGLVYNTAGLQCYYRIGPTGAATQLTLATQTAIGAHSDGGFAEIDATNMKGVYRLDLSDTMVANAGMLTVYVSGATNMAPVVLEIEVVTFVNDIWAKAMTELTSIPAINGTVLEALSWVFTLSRNKLTQDSTEQALFKDDASTKLAEADITDSGGVFTRGEWRTPT